jgi:ribosome-associated heat shock protein Hsp15
MEAESSASLRIDKWLWAARFFKTRSLAADACTGGHVKVKDNPVKPAHAIKIGDFIEIRREGWTQVIEVKLLSEIRGPAVVAQTFYADHSPPRPIRLPPIAQREAGAGRPTKRDRRQIEQIRRNLDHSLWEDDA